MPAGRPNDSLSFFLLLAGYLLFAIALLVALRVAVFDYWLGTASPPSLATMGLMALPACMIALGHFMRRKCERNASADSGK